MDTTVYHYIADHAPSASRSIIESFGYRVVDPRRMGDNLRTLVANEGEDALTQVLALHPDKEVILELFSVEKPCESCKERKIIEKYANASGSEKSEAKIATDNFSLLFLAGVTIIAIAIIK